MIDPGEKVSRSLRREFGEEALQSLEMPEAEKTEVLQMIDEFFKEGTEIYKG